MWSEQIYLIYVLWYNIRFEVSLSLLFEIKKESN